MTRTIGGSGEQGKPKIKANKPAPKLSSEKERCESKPHHKGSKQSEIKIDRVEVLKVDREGLPQDIQFKGYEEVIVQDIEFRTENIKFGHPRNTTPQAVDGHIWLLFLLVTEASSGRE